MKDILVIVPARAGSKGIKDKNIRLLGDAPLLVWPLRALRDAKVRARCKILLSSDSEEYLRIAQSYIAFEELTSVQRPSYLAGDTASSYDTFDYHLNNEHANGHSYRYILVLEPTSPFTQPCDIDRAVEILDGNSDLESVVGIGKVKDQHPVFLNRISAAGILSPYLGHTGTGVRRQDVEDLYFYDGSLYISRIDSFYANKGFYGDRAYGFEFSGMKNIEIDEPDDFALAQLYVETLDEN